MVDRIAAHPLARAVRADKTCLAGMAATLRHYARDEAEREIPVWRMIATPVDDAGGPEPTSLVSRLNSQGIAASQVPTDGHGRRRGAPGTDAAKRGYLD